MQNISYRSGITVEHNDFAALRQKSSNSDLTDHIFGIWKKQSVESINDIFKFSTTKIDNRP